MKTAVTVLHSIPGRIRLHIPQLSNVKESETVEELMSSIEGIERVRIENITKSMLIYYDCSQLKTKDVLHYVSLFFSFVEEAEADESDADDRSFLAPVLSAWYRFVVSVEKSINTNMKIFNAGKSVYRMLIKGKKTKE